MTKHLEEDEKWGYWLSLLLISLRPKTPGSQKKKEKKKEKSPQKLTIFLAVIIVLIFKIIN